MSYQTAPDPKNYMYGKGSLFFKRDSETGFYHLGNVPSFSLNVDVSTEDHYTSMSGTKEKDLSFVSEKSATASLTLEEVTPRNIALAFLGAIPTTETQAAAILTGTALSLVEGAYVETGNLGMWLHKIVLTEAPTETPEAATTVTGSTSNAGGVVVSYDASTLTMLLFPNIATAFQAGETISVGNGSGTVASYEQVNKIALTDANGETFNVYTEGTDYSYNARSGMVCQLAGGSIENNTAYLFAGVPALTKEVVSILSESDSVQGQLRFIGNPDRGRKLIVDCWKTKLTLSSDFNLIGDDISTLECSAEILTDSTNHPDFPFIKVTNAYAE